MCVVCSKLEYSFQLLFNEIVLTWLFQKQQSLFFRHADLIALGGVYTAMWEQQLTAHATEEEQESEGAVNNKKPTDRNEWVYTFTANNLNAILVHSEQIAPQLLFSSCFFLD